MNPLILLNWRVWAVLGLAAALMFTGWKAHSMGEAEVQAKWDAQSLEIAKQSLKLSEEATRTTDTLQANADETIEAKNAKITKLSSDLYVALNGLRNRPQRPAGIDLSKGASAGANTSCTGAQLYREDAEFLDREAARAERLLADLAQCQTQYNTVREALNPKK